MDERGAFLGTIRKALGYQAAEVRTARQCLTLFAERDDSKLLDRIQYRTHVEKQALLTILEDNGAALNLDVHPVRSLESAAETIVAIVSKTIPEFSSSKQIIQHDHPDIAELQLWKCFAGEAITLHTAYEADSEVKEKSIASSVGITVPDWCVAESATLIQLAGPGRPRSTSLLPTVHIALLRLENLLADLGEAYCLLRQEPPKESFVFISGPSKTADIEAHLVYGAHGPREVHLVVIDEQLAGSRSYQGSGLFPGG